MSKPRVLLRWKRKADELSLVSDGRVSMTDGRWWGTVADPTGLGPSLAALVLAVEAMPCKCEEGVGVVKGKVVYICARCRALKEAGHVER